MPFFYAVVGAERANEGVGRLLLHDVGRPADDAAGDEQRRERRGVEAHDVVGRAARVVEVGLDALAVIHRLLQRVVQLAEILAAELGDQGVERRLHGGHPGVAVLVDPVPEAHDLALLGERGIQPGLGLVGRADLVEDVHDGLVGSAVQRALERADRAGHGGVQVGQGRGDHPRGEGARVEGVLRVQDHRDVEGVDHRELGNFAEGHVQQVRRESEVLPRLDELLAAAATLVVGDDAGQLREQVDRAALVELRVGDSVRLVQGGVGGADHADRGAHDIHRMRRERQLVDDPLGARIERPQRALQLLELLELLGSGQFTVPEQVGDLLEGAVLGEFLHRVSAIQQGVALGVHLGDRRVVDDDSGKALVDFFAHVSPYRSGLVAVEGEVEHT